MITVHVLWKHIVFCTLQDYVLLLCQTIPSICIKMNIPSILEFTLDICISNLLCAPPCMP